MRSGSETHLRRIFSLELPVESPLQCAGRISVAMLPARTGSSSGVFLFEEYRRNFFVVVYALDHVGEHVGDGQHREFVQVLVGVERNGVRHDHLLQRAVIDAFVCRTRKHGVGDGGADALGPARHEHVGGHAYFRHS